MSSDELEYVVAVCSAPEDSTPRLVYADWLDDHGSPERAEFIRVQCEIARGPPYPSCRMCNGSGQDVTDRDGKLQIDECDDCRDRAVPVLRRRERELLRDHVARLVGLPGGVSYAVNTARILWTPPGSVGDCFPVEVRRGFINSITCPAEVWLAHADAIAWRPSWKDVCRGSGCKEGTVGRPKPSAVGGQWTGRICDVCGGDELVHRSCPPTAQPVEVVRITTVTDEIVRACNTATMNFTGPTAWQSLYHESSLWPGIKFVLPRDSGV